MEKKETEKSKHEGGFLGFAGRQEERLEKKFGKEKVRGFERYVVFMIYISVFLAAGYFFLVTTNPDLLPSNFYSYKVSASESMIGSNLRSLYLDDTDALGGVLEINGESVRMIVSEKPFNFVFNPKRKIDDNSSAEVRLHLVNPSTEVYLNEKLIVPDLDGFVKVADFENRGVWVKEELTKSDYIDGGSSEDFIYANFPGQNIYSFGDIEGGTPIIADYKKTKTFINTRFRDDLKLAVYAEGKLEIEFVKQDMNAQIGKDEYTVEIKDIQGNSYFNEVYEDDGDKKASGIGEFEQRITVIGRDLPENIYYITFTKDENNKYADSSIKDIRINSNKVLIVGRNLPLEAFDFYTEVGSSKIIGFYYWHSGKDQEIIISGTEDIIIDLNENWKGEKYEEELSRGEYNFDIPKGDVWVYSDVISPTKSSWFYLPQEGDRKLVNQDILIIDKDKLEIDGNKVVYTGMIDIKAGSKIKIQVLDKLETYFKEIKLVL
jgi:hypothetical protein